MAHGPSTRAVHAGLPPARQGEPFLPGPVLAAPFHLRGEIDSSPYTYGRDGNPTFAALEAAIGALEEAEAVTFASGMAAATAVIETCLAPGDAFVLIDDGYPGVRGHADRLRARGDDVRFVPTDTGAIVAAVPGARLVWIETPSNPRLAVADIAAVAAACREAGARLVVDNTLATPLGQRPLELGADVVMYSATKAMSGHSDVLLGAVTTRDPALREALVHHRVIFGSVPGPFEAWLVHRSLATLELRLARQSANAAAVAQLLAAHGRPVLGVDHPGLGDHPGHAVAARQMRHAGPLVSFELPGAEAAQAFLRRLELVAEATSFGGVHSTAERRARWAANAVPPGYIRFSAGCEDPADLLADVAQALRGV